ncbi:MAG: SIMPL domain-containing protein [Patescibacteria group bacterium]
MIQKKELLNFTLKAIILFVSACAILRLSTSLFGPIPLSINTKTLDKDNTFFVSSDSSVFVKPDIASVVLSIETTDQTASAAQKKANEIINKVTEELKKIKVDGENIKTINYNIYPIYGTDGKQIESYRASVSVRVKVKELETINQVIDTSTANGVNSVSGITFEVENKDKAIDTARQEAINKAKEKAQKIAGEAGIRLGKVINVTEYYPGDFPPIAMEAFSKGLGGGGGDTQIQSGQTEIKVNVTLSYETY